jgi:small-conductance mechanosensitive channel/CRP-like cAMP-binding protein
MTTGVLDKFLSLFTHTLVKIGKINISIISIVNLVFLIFIVFVFARFIKLIFKHFLLSKLGLDLGNREAISTFMAYLFGSIALIFALQTSGFDLSSLAVILGGLGIGIGFGLQNITRDLISGLIIIFNQRIRLNDFIEFGRRQEFPDLRGTVDEISLLSTIIMTNDGASLILPNSYLIDRPIINWGYKNQKNRIRIPIKVNKDSDLVLVTETVLNTAYRESYILQEPNPQLIFVNLSDDYWEFELQVWIESIKFDEPIRSALNYALEYQLRNQGVKLISPLNDWLLDPEKLTLLIQGKTPVADHLNNQNTSIKDFLKRIKYFKGFNELDILKVIQIGYLKSLQRDEILFNEGDPGDAFYIILSGAVEIFTPKIQKRLTILKAGEFLGELSLILGIPRTASVRAIETSILFAINNQGFKQLLSQKAELSEIIINELAKHQAELTERKRELRAMGLIDDREDDANLVVWLRKRLSRLFG